jgi:hypothetical protein
MVIMIGPAHHETWIAAVCNSTSATLIVARGIGPRSQVIAQQTLELDASSLERGARINGLDQFVAAHQLAGAAVRIAFAAAGCTVQKLQMPRLTARNRNRAIRTRLTNYAAGRQLVIRTRLEPGSATGQRSDGTQVLAAGVESSLARGLYRACRQAGLCVQWMTALADLFESPQAAGRVVQLIVGEQMTTIQLFNADRLVGCRDVLLGRREFVAAYQRPIFTARGPVTLSAADAEVLARTVGIPVGREDEIRPGLPATQLWPMLTPVLQKLLREVEQSLTHSRLKEAGPVAIRVLGVPALPGLAEYLAEDLQLQLIRLAPAAVEAEYLAAWSDGPRRTARLDLRPAEERIGERFTRPALAAGLCALLIIVGNSVVPRAASAQLAAARPVAQQLDRAVGRAATEYEQVVCKRDELVAGLQQQLALSRALPRHLDAVELVQQILQSVPPDVTLVDLGLELNVRPARVCLRATYRGPVAASVVVGHWARSLSESPWSAGARVTAVSGSGRERPAQVELEARLK